ncbi:phage tail assembly chaperone [Pectinatus haikarae]|uniref:Uncharacterized protein n=1 Tax=Pectinatus haikarae TaxID=349096 RepID=A0ABT9Y3S6_9FIRM|nr:hypothetical protein [Pectinatus haikarae]MDQ0202477.1 hypothetical protein [Pectinatus haikarae]
MGREKSKVIEIMDRKFEIKKFDAFTGGYIIFQLFEKFLPMGIENKIPTQKGKNLSDILPQSRTVMTKAEFKVFMQDCLSAAGEVLPARTAPIINADNGSWGVENIQDNTMLAILLCINVLTYNMSDFFVADGLKELKKALSSLPGIFPVNIKI